MENGEESPLERVRRRLYSRNPNAPLPAGSGPSAPPAPSGWTGAPDPSAKKGLPMSVIFLIAAAGFFVVAGLAAALILFLGGRSVSTDRISISIEGPAAVAGGEEAPLFVVVKNQNPVAATGVSISIEFPEGAYSADNPSEPLAHYAADLPDIPAGDSARESIRAIFYGAEGEEVVIPIRVEYRAENSSATFVKEEEHRLAISSSPLSVRVTATDGVASGQPVTLTASVRSNAPSRLEDVGVEVAYPFGFTLSDASPAPAGTLFRLGAMNPGDEREIRLTGVLTGQDGDERVFSFSAGVLPSPEARSIAKPVYAIAQAPVRIEKSFLGVALSLNGSQAETIAVPAGEEVQGVLTWSNSIESAIADGRIVIALSGDALDPSSVSATSGFYRSSDRTVSFTPDTEQGLANLAPGDSGNGSFRFRLKDASELSKLRNPSVTLAISVAGRRVGEGRPAENLYATLTRTVQVATGLSLSADLVRTVGQIENMGPWPPEVDKETTYTVRLSTGNSVNSVANARVYMTLPPYVRYTGVASPGDSFSFDETTRLLTWSVGELPADAETDAAFQIAFTPTASQAGKVPVLVSGIAASGFDRFTQSEITAGAEPLTTEAENDPAFQSGFERVK